MYQVQDQPRGIAHALGLCEGFAADGKICVVLGDNIFGESIAPYISRFRDQATGARILLRDVADPERHGVAIIQDRRLIEIEEKPIYPRSPLAVLGLYFYDSEVFEIIQQVQPSARGEYEITTVNNSYIKKGRLEYDLYEGGWTDAGTFSSWFEANEMMMKACG
jgi:glucose-1-phosphate thymidylyltransferase